MRPQRLRYYVSTLFSKLHGTVCIFLSLLIISISVYFFYSCEHFNEIPLELIHYQKLLAINGSSSGICEVPRLNPWDPTILKYYTKINPLTCAALQENVTELQDGMLKILEKYRNDLFCRCRTFDHNEGVSDFIVKFDEWMDVDAINGQRILKDFVEVECYSKGLIPGKVYSYHWNQIVPQKISLLTKKPFLQSSLDRPSVVIFGLDSMSRSNFIRTLPKSHKQLQSMGFIDMLGHVKIADNTFQNWAAFLTGKRASSTREFKGELPDEWYIFFDDWPLIWKKFSQAGYVTFFAEDRPDIATFNYFSKLYGFKNKPTDHYFRPYWLGIFWNLLKMRSTPYCYNDIPTHMLQLNYLKEFIRKYDGKRLFSFYWSQDLSHDYLNQVGVADDDFAAFFKEVISYSRNTIFIVVSDHGHRYDSIRETIVGRLESRLPYLSIYLPQEFIFKFPDAYRHLKKNSKKMTTQFDLYETLIDVVNASFSKEKKILQSKKAYSLLGKMPQSRHCFDANIPEDYCPCFNEIEIPKPEAKEPAKHFMNYVNDILAGKVNTIKRNELKKGYKCLQLNINKILYASVRLPPSALVKDPQVKQTVAKAGLELRYRIVIKVQQPSSAVIEGVVIKDLKTNSWTATGEIERNNKYGNTSHCAESPLLKKICYCVLT